MNALVDSKGVELPPIEVPSPEKLRVYGDALFLAFRSRRHAGLSVQGLRSWLEPAVETGQFRLYRFDGVPRAMLTWARLTRDGERRLIQGDALSPQDWTGGDRLWIIDLIVPYRGLTAQIVRSLMVPGNLSDSGFLFRRVSGANETRRIVQVDFNAPRLARVWSEAEFLDSLN